jgi:hypothetical protein
MEIFNKGVKCLLLFIHPDYASAFVLNFFDGINSTIDVYLLMVLNTISLLTIVLTYYYIAHRHKKK